MKIVQIVQKVKSALKLTFENNGTVIFQNTDIIIVEVQ